VHFGVRWKITDSHYHTLISVQRSMRIEKHISTPTLPDPQKSDLHDLGSTCWTVATCLCTGCAIRTT